MKNQIMKKIPEGYKQTEIGVIPEDWEVVPTSNLGNFSKGQGIRKDESLSGNIPCIRYGEIYTHHNNIVKNYNSWISPIVAKTSRKLKKGDILFAGSGETKEEIGKCVAFISAEEAYAGGDIVILSPTKGDSSFFGYLFNSPIIVSQKSSKGQGDAVVHISASALSTIDIPLPPKPEQTAIATVLSDTDALIEHLEKLIAKKKAIKQGAMQQLLIGKKRLPGFNGEWEVKKLGEIVDFSNGKAHENFISDDGDYIVVNSKFISSEGQVIKYSKQCFCPAPANSILLVMSDVPNGKAIAKCFLVDKNDKYTVNQRICALRPKIDARFLFYKINRNSYYLAFDDGVKQTNLRKDDVLGCKLSIPKEEPEQTAIATILFDMDAEIKSLEQKKDKYTMLKQGMMQQLLTGRIRIYANN
jgi:type I restriction enzyme S subunit